jgi:allantoin racemase
MLGLAQNLEKQLVEIGLQVPVVDPTASAIGYLELLHRSGLTQSLFTYPSPPEKERRF